MTHYRSQYRADVGAALRADPHFAELTQMSAWAQNIDPSSMPVFGVATPRETSTREGGTTVSRGTTVQVALKRVGGEDLEDVLDEDSIAVERVVLPSLLTVADIVALVATDTTIGFEGGQRIGTLIMDFTAIRFTAEGATN